MINSTVGWVPRVNNFHFHHGRDIIKEIQSVILKLKVVFLPPIWQPSKHFKLLRVTAYIVQVTIKQYWLPVREYYLNICNKKCSVHLFPKWNKNVIQFYYLGRTQHGLRCCKQKELELLILSPGNLWHPLNFSNTFFRCKIQGRLHCFIKERRRRKKKRSYKLTLICIHVEINGTVKHLKLIPVTLEWSLPEFDNCLLHHLYRMDSQGYASPPYLLYYHCLLLRSTHICPVLSLLTGTLSWIFAPVYVAHASRLASSMTFTTLLLDHFSVSRYKI